LVTLFYRNTIFVNLVVDNLRTRFLHLGQLLSVMTIIYIYKTIFSFIIKTIDSYPVTTVVSPCQLVHLTKRQKIITIQTIVVLGLAIHAPFCSEPDKLGTNMNSFRYIAILSVFKITTISFFHYTNGRVLGREVAESILLAILHIGNIHFYSYIVILFSKGALRECIACF